MLSNFNGKKLLYDFSQISKAKSYKKIIEDELNKTRVAQMLAKANIDELEEQKSNALVEQRKISIFSRIASIFHVGKYYRMSQSISEREKALKDARNKLQELYENEEELIVKVDSLSNFINAEKLPEYVREEDGRVVITDKTNDNKEEPYRNGTEISPEKKVLVHSTNFFPKNHRILSSYDGEKTITAVPDYHGVKKEVTVLSTRHEVHCTINNRVQNTGAGEGSWDNPEYIVIDDYAAHEGNMESKSASDAWTNGTSLDLSPNAVILVDINKKSKLPLQDDNMSSYSIVYYDGDATECLHNFLRLNNYELIKTDANDASHAYSMRDIQEDGTFVRNVAINFMLDNAYNSRDALELSAREIAQVTDIAVSAMRGTKIPNLFDDRQIQDNVEGIKVSTEKGSLYKDIANFVVSSGIKKNANGTYTFKSDDEIMEDIEEVKSDKSKIPSCVDIDLIDEIFMMQQQLAKQYSLAEKPSLEVVNQMPLSEVFKFKNQLACEVLQESLPELTSLIGNDDGKVVVDMYIEDSTDIRNKIRSDDNISYGRSGAYANYGMRYDVKSKKVLDVPNLLVDFERKVQEIKDRSENAVSVYSQR